MLQQAQTYLTRHYDRIIEYTVQHFRIVLIAFAISLLVAIPIALLITKVKAAQIPVIGVFNAIFAIPSLVLYTLMIPITGLGIASAIIALVLYSQFSLVKNIAEGFRSVDPAVIEAARGIGLSKPQIFFQVEFPLALPLILSGMRLAITSITTMAILATSIGAGGLGVLLFDGLRANNWGKILIGTVLTSAFVLIMNLLFQFLEKKALQKATGNFG